MMSSVYGGKFFLGSRAAVVQLTESYRVFLLPHSALATLLAFPIWQSLLPQEAPSCPSTFALALLWAAIPFPGLFTWPSPHHSSLSLKSYRVLPWPTFSPYQVMSPHVKLPSGTQSTSFLRLFMVYEGVFVWWEIDQVESLPHSWLSALRRQRWLLLVIIGGSQQIGVLIEQANGQKEGWKDGWIIEWLSE